MAKRAAIYIRVSTQEQSIRGMSVEAQEEALLKFIKNEGYILNTKKHIYIDRGKSGANEDREELINLMTGAKKGEFDIVLVWKVDRFFRKTVSLLQYVDYLVSFNVSFKSITQDFAADTGGGKMILSIFGILAELERDMIRERTSMGKIKKAQEGYYVGGGTATLGYKFIKDGIGTKLEIIEEEKELVNRIFEMYVKDRKTQGEIARILESEGIKTKSVRLALEGNKSKKVNTGVWNTSSISKILNNTMYMGEYYYGKTYTVKNSVTKMYETKKNPKDKMVVLESPIILKDISLFEEAQELLVKNKLTRNNPNNYNFAGLIKCGHCGRAYVGYYSSKRTRHYRCKGKMSGIPKKDKCINNEISEDYLIDICWKYIYKVFKSPDKAIEEYYGSKTKNNNIDKDIKKLNGLKDKEKKLYLAIKKLYKENQLIDNKDEIKMNEEVIDEFKIEKENISIEINKLNKKIISMKDKEAHLNNLNQLKAFYEKKIESISDEKKIEIIKELVEKIIIEKGSDVIIKFKFENNSDDDDTWKEPEDDVPSFLQPNFDGNKSCMVSNALPINFLKTYTY